MIPADATERVEYEGEIVGVIGRRARNLSEEEALDCLLGYTIGNDVSERTWQKGDRTMWRAKNTDTFKPMGPWIETEVDLDSMRTRVSVNGEQKIDFATNNMLFGMATYLSRMSRYLTLYPRDVIWMGTEGHADPIKHGDVVTSIDGQTADMTIRQLQAYLHLNRDWGDQVDLVLRRAGKSRTVRIQFPDERPN